MPKIDEYVIDDQAEQAESTSEKKNPRPTSWAGIFAVDVPMIYFDDDPGLPRVEGVPIKLPKQWHLHKHYLEAYNAGYGFNQYALARTLKSERGPTTGGAGGERWQRFSGQYKAIGSMVLCRMIGCGGMPYDPNNVPKNAIFGPGKLYPQTTGLVRLAVSGQHDWGPFGKDGKRQGAAFATTRDIDFDDPDDQFLLEVCKKILTGEYFIGDELYGAVSFIHPKKKWDEIGIYQNLDMESVRRAHRELDKESPYGEQPPPKSMGKMKACWTGPLEDASGGMQATQIICYTKIPVKTSKRLRLLPSRLPWTEKEIPRIPDPPGFENARDKGMIRKDYQIATKKKPTLVELIKEDFNINPHSDYFSHKDSKNNLIPAQKGFFIMDGHLINALRKVSGIDLSSTTSFVKLFYFDKQEKRNKTINVHLIDNPDFTPEALAENRGRPDAGLVSMDIAVQEEAGVHMYMRITLKFKVYNPAVFDPGGILFPFFYPEYPFGIEYGTKYSGPNEDQMVQRVLNWTEIKLANPTSYDIQIDDKGIYDFTIHAVAGAEHAFSKMHIGSFMLKDSEKIQDEFTKAYSNYKAIKAAIQELEQKREQHEASNTLTKQEAKKLKKDIQASDKKQKQFTKEMQVVLGDIIADRFKKLEEKSVTNINYKPKKKGAQKKKNWVTVGDLIREFCMDDLYEALMMYATSDSAQPALVWGRFNKNCGDYANKIMHELLVPLDEFKTRIQSQADVMTQSGIRLDWLMSQIESYFHSDVTLYKLNKKKGEYDNFQSCNFISYVQHDIGKNGTEYIQYVIADRNRGIDYAQEVTQIFMPNEEQVEAAPGEKDPDPVEPLSRGQRKLALNEKNCAYIQLMEAHAFMRNVNMHAEQDQNIIAISMEKIYGYKSVVSDLEREHVPSDKHDSATTLSRLRLPLAGTIEVVAFPFWKPLRSLYIFFDTEDWDRFYAIKNVTYSYTVGLPIATLDLMYYN